MTTTIDGVDCKIYHGTAGSTAATLLANARNGTVNGGVSEADVSIRGVKDKLTKSVRRDRMYDFELLYVPGDTGFLALETAYETGGLIAILILDGLKATAGSRGPDFDATVTRFDRDENLDGVVTYQVTVKPSLGRAPVLFVGV